MIKVKNVFKSLIIGCLAILLISGCSRNVTDKTTILTIEITVTLEGDVDTENNNYMVILSTGSSPEFPTIPPYIYFPTPGRSFDEFNTDLEANGGLSYYFENFFESWMDYIVINNNDTLLYKSESTGFDSTISTATENSTILPDTDFTYEVTYPASDIIKLSFNIQQLSSVPSSLYFNVATSSISDDSESGIIYDYLEEADGISITVEASSQATKLEDTEDNGIHNSVDITDVSVEIF